MQYKIFSYAAASLAGLGLMAPPAVLAAQPSPAPAAAAAYQKSAIVDVALLEGGRLQGQVVDAQGAPIAATPVAVRFEGRDVATATTNAQGYFAVAGLHGGTFEVAAAGSQGVYRLWSPNTAPPSSNAGVLVVAGQEVTRGQLFGNWTGPRLLMAGVMGGIVTAGVIAASGSRSGS